MTSLRFWVSIVVCSLPALARGAELHLDRIRLPPGFAIDVYAEGVKNARQMALGPSGVVFVSTRREGNVYALIETKRTNKADRIVTLAKGLQNPNGVAFRGGALYVAERSRVLRYDDIERHLDSPPKPVVIRDDFPTEAHHGWKFIAFGPDGWLYVPVGAPCNVCKSDAIFATITRVSADGKQREIYSSGVRNTVGFDWHPDTGVLWFTDNGRDEMGDDTPPDELDRAPRAGLHFGFPYCHGSGIADPEFGRERPCSEFTPSVADLGPHVAALGMRFYTGSMFPPEYRRTSSSRSMARGTAPCLAGTGWCGSCSTATRSFRKRCSPQGGCRPIRSRKTRTKATRCAPTSRPTPLPREPRGCRPGGGQSTCW